MKIIIFLGVLVVIYDILSIVNIGLNIKYQIDVFENGDNITEFKNIIKREVQGSASTILLNLVYIIIALIALIRK
ncbi:hypothetical protein [uncultured Weeksella sp.]|uniref:hypothetical protein n=1 Tax=uncultured Weeksella sp. TaxID=1161389 RepID=UPI00259BEAD5|nr:hypothetical protein [uncultured Weeksella sp.]